MKVIIPIFIASFAFALYVTCPRMTAMIATEAKLYKINPLIVIVLGCILGIPLFMALFYTLKYLGLEAAIILAALFDFMAALLLGKLSLKLGIELLIITTFVYVGIRLAPILTDLILKIIK